jgi:aspartyl-tRNA(Asn)/glutamyl-tRNA(Gln) amidotransferase subunit A
MGWLFRDLEDAPFFAAPFAPAEPASHSPFTRFAAIADSFLHDCEPEIIASFHNTIRELQALGLQAQTVSPAWWSESADIFSPIQASEASRIHAGHFDRIQPDIRERLEWGARIAPAELAALRQRHAAFNMRMNDLFAEHQLLLLPCAPVARLAAGADHSKTRVRLLRYTTPFSLAGVPAVAIPCAIGGMQLAASRGFDEPLLQLAARLGVSRKSAAPISRTS